MRNKKYFVLLGLLLSIALFVSYMTHESQKNELLDLEATPIIVIHGYNPLYSSQLSQITLKELAGSLAEDLHRVDKGVFYKDTTCDQLGSIKPIVIRASYFNDFELVGIPEYAENLGKIIETVKKCTHARRVNIVAHSMGGIVARYYIQHVDNESIKKLVMLGTPNHGQLYNIGEFTYFFDEEDYSKLHLDFIQLAENGTFMQELNSGIEGKTQYYTIAGKIDETGDGLVAESSVHLPYADNFVVECNHFNLKIPSFCPEAYERVVGC
jgi:uncharacterized alpha/beta hydrolase family protein